MDGAAAAPAVSIRGALKSFGSTRALDGLDLEVTPGEVHGFLGPNGAGKTVTLRIALGLLRPDGGSFRVLGGDPWRDAVALHRRIGYSPGEVQLRPRLTGGEVIDLLGSLQGGLDRRRRDELIDDFDLDPGRRCRSYSKGNRQKVALIAALAAEVELYLMDEPTSGLDPLMEAVFQNHVARLVADGRTVLLSSHILAQVEHLCDRVTIIRKGRTVESGTLDELRHLTRTSITAVTSRPVDGLADLAGVHGLRLHGDRLDLDVDSDHLDPVMRALLDAGITSINAHPPTLEELFLRHYGDDVSGVEDDGADPLGSGARP